MKVVITGGAGFIGHHLVNRLALGGCEVLVLDNLRRGSFERPGLAGATCVAADVRDYEACLPHLLGADAVVHLAAQSNVMGSEHDPAYTYETNVTGTWNIAAACREAGVPHLVFASSREVYGDPEILPVTESASFAPRNLYGASKAAAELLLGALSDGPAVSILRLGNVIGKGDANRVVPLWLHAARSGAPLRVFGGKQELDLVPIDFVCRVFETTLQQGPLAEPINVGTGTTTEILSLANFLRELVGSASAVEVLPPRGPEVVRFRADTTRLSAHLGLTPPANPLAAIRADW